MRDGLFTPNMAKEPTFARAHIVASPPEIIFPVSHDRGNRARYSIDLPKNTGRRHRLAGARHAGNGVHAKVTPPATEDTRRHIASPSTHNSTNAGETAPHRLQPPDRRYEPSPRGWDPTTNPMGCTRPPGAVIPSAHSKNRIACGQLPCRQTCRSAAFDLNQFINI